MFIVVVPNRKSWPTILIPTLTLHIALDGPLTFVVSRSVFGNPVPDCSALNLLFFNGDIMIPPQNLDDARVHGTDATNKHETHPGVCQSADSMESLWAIQTVIWPRNLSMIASPESVSGRLAYHRATVASPWFLI